MRSIYKGRACGKTLELIRRSAELDYPIIVKDKATGRGIKERAKEMGLCIPEPISIVSVIDGRTDRVKSNAVLVDDADYILDRLINHMIGCHVDTIALVARNEKGHELDRDGDDLIEKYCMGNDRK